MIFKVGVKISDTSSRSHSRKSASYILLFVHQSLSTTWHEL